MVEFPKDTNPVLTIREAIVMARTCRSVLYDLMKAGEIEYVKPRTKRLIVADSLKAYLNRGEAA